MMGEATKKGTRSFLEKFEGRTNKVSRNGLQGVLFGEHNKPAKTEKEDNDHIRQVDLDKLIPSNPQRLTQQEHLRKREFVTRPPLKAQTKYEYIPSRPA